MASIGVRKKQSPYQTSVVNYIHQRSHIHGSCLGRDLVRGRLAEAKSLYRRDLIGHFGCVNAIEFSHGNSEWIVSGGDDSRVLVWNVQKALSKRHEPVVMKGKHNSNIFCLSFDHRNKKIFSGGNDEQVLVHDFETGANLDVFFHDDVVYGLSVDPNNDNVFASAADDGRVRIYDIREPANGDDYPFCLAECLSSMHAVMYNPVEPRLLFTANNDDGVGLWDIRRPKKCLLKYGADFGDNKHRNCMNVRVNSLGTQVIGLYRRRPLMLYNIDSPNPVCKFSCTTTDYSNSCTMKSCSFAGDKDQYVLSGSDSFHVFMWEVPDKHNLIQKSTVHHIYNTHMLLKGHRSIVNQVRYSNANHLLVSSGVEKVVKIWSPFPIPDGDGDLINENNSSRPERVRFTQEQYMNIIFRHDMMHDYSNGNVEEDPHMMAFFDSLIEAGGDPWSSDGESSSVDIPQQTVIGDLGDLSSQSDSSESSGSSLSRGRVRVRVPRAYHGETVRPQSTSSGSGRNNLNSSGDLCLTSQSRDSKDGAGSSSHHSNLNIMSESESSGTETSSQRAHRAVKDTPYRAKAKKAVRRLRKLRSRVENSDTSDSSEDSDDCRINMPKQEKNFTLVSPGDKLLLDSSEPGSSNSARGMKSSDTDATCDKDLHSKKSNLHRNSGTKSNDHSDTPVTGNSDTTYHESHSLGSSDTNSGDNRDSSHSDCNGKEGQQPTDESFATSHVTHKNGKKCSEDENSLESFSTCRNNTLNCLVSDLAGLSNEANGNVQSEANGNGPILASTSSLDQSNCKETAPCDLDNRDSLIESSDRPVWKDFKKLNNGKSRRQYRQRSGSERALSSGEDSGD